MAATARALLRRRAAPPPSLALLQPLFPGRYSTPRSPFLAAAAVVVGLPDVRHSQLSPAPVSLQPLLCYYSSKPSKGCVPPPQQQPQTGGNETPRLEPERKEDVEFLTEGLQEDLEKHTRNLIEALAICRKADALLNEGWDNKTVAMFENGLEKAFEAVADHEKVLDDISGALDSSNALPKDTLQLQKLQMFHKKWIDNTKFIRQELNGVQALFATIKKEQG